MVGELLLLLRLAGNCGVCLSFVTSLATPLNCKRPSIGPCGVTKNIIGLLVRDVHVNSFKWWQQQQ